MKNVLIVESFKDVLPEVGLEEYSIKPEESMKLSKQCLLDCSRMSYQCYEGNKDAWWYKDGKEKHKDSSVFTTKEKFEVDNVWGWFATNKNYPKTLFVVNCGSDNDRGLGKGKKKDWDYNLDFKKVVTSITKSVNKGKNKKMIIPYGNKGSKIRVHRGHDECYKKIMPLMRRKLRSAKFSGIDTVIFTGHSLGASLATLGAVDAQYNFGDYYHFACVPISSPKVGNKAFSKSFNKRIPCTYRLVYGRDVVTKIPPIGYKHVDNLHHFGKYPWWKFFIPFSALDHRPFLICDGIEKETIENSQGLVE
jgi:hypothetical protein